MVEVYTIMEYDSTTKSYSVIGYSQGSDSADAKSQFVEKNSYRLQQGKMLFAKLPLCR